MDPASFCILKYYDSLLLRDVPSFSLPSFPSLFPSSESAFQPTSKCLSDSRNRETKTEARDSVGIRNLPSFSSFLLPSFPFFHLFLPSFLSFLNPKVPIFDFEKMFQDFRDHHVWFISSLKQTFWMSTSASILLRIIITMILNGIWVIFIHILLQTVVPRWAKELMCIVITCLYRIAYLTRHLDYPWNEMFSALLSISEQAFSMQISEPRWNKASYLEANSYSSLVRAEEPVAGAGVRGGETWEAANHHICCLLQ